MELNKQVIIKFNDEELRKALTNHIKEYRDVPQVYLKLLEENEWDHDYDRDGDLVITIECE